jgi:myosin V
VNEVVENLVDLDELSEGAILHHVRKRFKKHQIYTHVGAILVAVNPFERLDIYGPNDLQKALNHVTPYPHVYVTAATAYRQLQSNMKDQSVLISGESGAGRFTLLE